MALRELAADEKTEPGAWLRAEPWIVDPKEALEDLVMLVAREANAAVARWAGPPSSTTVSLTQGRPTL